jgi:hypothetical protein
MIMYGFLPLFPLKRNAVRTFGFLVTEMGVGEMADAADPVE